MKYLLLLSSLFLASCASDITQYESNSPKLDLTEYFSGKLCAWGTVSDFSGDVSRRFVATIEATSSQDSFTLDEIFKFDDGERQTRLWKFNKTNNQWIGTAGDVEGEAIGEVSGNVMSLLYDLNVQMDDDVIRLAMDDVLHLIDDNTMIGKTIMNKFGIQVGEINIVIQKQSNDFSMCQV